MYSDPVVSSLYSLSFVRPRGFVANNAPSQGWVMIYLQQGEMELVTKTNTLRLTGGEVACVPPGLRRNVRFLAETTRFTNFYFSLLSGDISRSLRILPADPQIEAIMAPVCTSLEGGAGDSCLCFSALYALLARFRHLTPVPEKYRVLLPAIRFIDTHFKQDHKVADYAAVVAMSETAFRRLFIEYTGYSPIDYRNRLRIQRAEALILDGATVAEAAAAVGFSGTSFYYRILKRNRG